jgi:hypothetical protein
MATWLKNKQDAGEDIEKYLIRPGQAPGVVLKSSEREGAVGLQLPMNRNEGRQRTQAFKVRTLPVAMA